MEFFHRYKRILYFRKRGVYFTSVIRLTNIVVSLIVCLKAKPHRGDILIGGFSERATYDIFEIQSAVGAE